jgi:hypothetical protein
MPSLRFPPPWSVKDIVAGRLKGFGEHARLILCPRIAVNIAKLLL